MKAAICALAGILAATSASAQSLGLKPELQGLGFLVGRWSTPKHGRVVETGGSSTGEVSFTPAVSGAVLLRQDHVKLYDAANKPTGSFEIMMMIYPESGGVHADYSDGDHVIHYTSTAIDPGRAVTFTSAPSPAAPTFRLSYVLTRPKVIDIAFSMAPPGSQDFHPIATGSVTKEPRPTVACPDDAN